MSLAGSFLIARPILKDPTFAQTVVLLLAHNADGAFGLVVNRPLKSKGLPLPLFNGGPCQSPGLVVLHGHADWVDPDAESAGGAVKQEVAPGVFVGDDSCLGRIGEPAAGQEVRCRAFQGFAGWGAGQLEHELTRGVWAVKPATGELLFGTPIDDLWDRLVPPSIPEPSLN
jgi:putative transcriptional regulator